MIWAVVAMTLLFFAAISWMFVETAPLQSNRFENTRNWLLAFADIPHRSAWAIWLFDYQGLIGGAFALIAGVVTVWQMRASDFANEARHSEIVSLQLLPVTRALERVQATTIDGMKATALKLLDLNLPEILTFEQLVDLGLPHMRPGRPDFGAGLMQTLTLQLSEETWNDFRPFMSGELSSARQRLTYKITEGQAAINGLWATAMRAGQMPAPTENNCLELLGDWQQYCSELRRLRNEISEGVNEVASFARKEVPR